MIHKPFLGSMFSEYLNSKQGWWHLHRRIPKNLFHSEYNLVAVEVYGIWLMFTREVRMFWRVQVSWTQNTTVRIFKRTESLCILYYTLLWFESCVNKVCKLKLEANVESRCDWTDADGNLHSPNNSSFRTQIPFFIILVCALIANCSRQHQSMHDVVT